MSKRFLDIVDLSLSDEAGCGRHVWTRSIRPLHVRDIIVIISAVTLSILLISCSSGWNRMVGTWDIDGHGTTMIFRADGTGEEVVGKMEPKPFEYTLDESKKPASLEVAWLENGHKTHSSIKIKFKDNDTIMLVFSGKLHSKPGHASALPTITWHRMK